MLTHRLVAVFTAGSLLIAPVSVHAEELSALIESPAPSLITSIEQPSPPREDEAPDSVEPIHEPTVSSTIIVAPEPMSGGSPAPTSSLLMADPPAPTVTTTDAIIPPTSTAPLLDVADSSIPLAPTLSATLTTSTTLATSTICLAIIAPYPLEGPEWVAFYGLTPSSSHRLLGWSLHDAQSSLVKITTSTALLWDEPSLTLRFHLRSSRLNNDGDTVTLRTELNDSHDTFTYTEVEKDQRWFRPDCASPWRIIPEPTIIYSVPPISPTSPTSETPTNTLPDAPPMMAVETAPLPPMTALVIEEDPPNVATPITPPVVAPTPDTELRPPAARIASSTAVLAVTHTAKTPAQKTAIKKTSASTKQKSASFNRTTAASSAKKRTPAKSTPKIITPPMSTILEQPASYQGVRVRLTGVVASTKKMIGAHTFVLLNSDGKGLLVQAKSTAPTPDRGQRIQITGVISWNDTGVWLKQQAQDSWTTLEEPSDDDAPSFALRTVALDAPGDEDAWSHVEIEGRVTDVQTASFDLETEDGLPLRVRLPKSLGYRAGRLEDGDSVRVRGLLDTRGLEPVLLPQVVEDIQIMARAPLPTQQEPRPVQAPWLPVGVIAGTLAASETLRRAGSWYKKRQEERAFATFLQEKSA